MTKKILFALLLMGSIAGCNPDMSNIHEITKEIERSSTTSQESELIEKLLTELRNQNIPVTIEVTNIDQDIPVQDIANNIESNLTVKVSFDDGNIFEWEPLDNNNIYLLLRE